MYALEDLDRDVAREQIGENRFLVGFIFDRGAARCRNVDWRGNGDQLLAGRDLEQRRTELRIEEMRDVERAGFVKLHDLRRNLGRLIEADVADAGRLLMLGDMAREQRSEEHTSALQSLMRHPYAVFC